MNEKSSKRREWVKTAAIVFLSVLLVLTFFSSTIMNYSLPEVATQYVEPGTITAKIRGTGMVESSDPYEVTVKETRKVSSVAVRQGDTVQEGDILVYLEDAESDELEEAKKALESAQDAYDLALLSSEVNSKVIQGANSGTPTETYRQRITAAQKRRDDLQKQHDEIAVQLEILASSEEQKNFNNAAAVLNSANDNLKTKEAVLEDLQNKLKRMNDKLDRLNAAEDTDPGDIEKQTKKIAAAEKERATAQKAVDEAKNVVNNAQIAYDIASRGVEGRKSDLESQQALIKVNLDAADNELRDLLGDIEQTMKLKTLYDAVQEAREKVEKLKENSIGATIKADIAGTIAAINATAGKEISAAEPVAVIQPEGKGFTMQFSVTNEQAKRLSVGDRADLVNAWRYDDVEVTLASIRPDPQNPGQNKQLTFDIKGNITAGQSLNVSVGQKSANYDLIVPNSALREDNNGKFILIVETKSTPLNNRYIATRVDVEVLASDDTRSAISGALYGYEYVITTATAPVEAGKQVRLADN